jgi:hypothetical protein
MGGNGKGNQSRSVASLRRRANDQRLLEAADAASEIIAKSRNPTLTFARFLIAVADSVQSFGAPAVRFNPRPRAGGDMGI